MPGFRHPRTLNSDGLREAVLAFTPRVIAGHEQGREPTRRIREQLDLHTELQR